MTEINRFLWIRMEALCVCFKASKLTKKDIWYLPQVLFLLLINMWGVCTYMTVKEEDHESNKTKQTKNNLHSHWVVTQILWVSHRNDFIWLAYRTHIKVTYKQIDDPQRATVVRITDMKSSLRIYLKTNRKL